MNYDTHYSMDESENNYAEGKMPDKYEYINMIPFI